MYDPLRKKEVAPTPEETVRQWFIEILEKQIGVPRHMMMSEVGFRYGSKQYRADILIYDRELRPLGVVECKRESVELDSAVVEQAMRYNAVLDVRYIFLTNGRKTMLFRREGDSFRSCTNLPKYESMI